MSEEFTAVVEENEVLDGGTYQAIFQGVEAPPEDGKFGPMLVWKFAAMTSDGPIDVTGRSSRPERFTKAHKAYDWYAAINGRAPEKGEVLSFAKLVGRPCRITLEIKVTEHGDFNRIVDVTPVKSQKRPVVPVADDEPPMPEADYIA